LHAPIATPTLDARVSHISGGKLLKKVDPVYSSGAMRMTGQVVLKATISREGTVTAVHIVSGQAMLAQAAAAAVKRWRYEPFLLNGVPIEVENTILVNFKAPGQE
jgi:protein TonB